MKEFRPRTRDIIVAGNDTTTTTVKRTMAELVQNPQVTKKVQEELAQVVVMDTCLIFKQNFLPMDKRLTQLVRGISMVM